MSIKQLLVIDIETVPKVERYEQLDEMWQKLWSHKIAFLKGQKKQDESQLWLERAGIYAEFSKVVCIGWGFLQLGSYPPQIAVSVHTEKLEYELLKNWQKTMLNVLEKKGATPFAGHNIQEFDIPFICRRLLANRLPLSSFLPPSGAKPWDFFCVDTMKRWRFGDYKLFTSLDLLACALGIDSPKNDMDGSMVAHYYYRTKQLDSIAAYCKQDVITTANVILALEGKEQLSNKNIKHL